MQALNIFNLHVNGTAGGFTVDIENLQFSICKKLKLQSFFHVAGSMPLLNTTMGKNMTITSAGGSVIIKLG